jgi:hypothetical protein
MIYQRRRKADFNGSLGIAGDETKSLRFTSDRQRSGNPAMKKIPKLKMVPWGAELWHAGIMVASVSGPTEASVDREIQHYVMICAQDGPIEIRFRPPTRSRLGQ